MDIPRRTKAAPDVPLESQQPRARAGALASQQPLLQRPRTSLDLVHGLTRRSVAAAALFCRRGTDAVGSAASDESVIGDLPATLSVNSARKSSSNDGNRELLVDRLASASLDMRLSSLRTQPSRAPSHTA